MISTPNRQGGVSPSAGSLKREACSLTSEVWSLEPAVRRLMRIQGQQLQHHAAVPRLEPWDPKPEAWNPTSQSWILKPAARALMKVQGQQLEHHPAKTGSDPWGPKPAHGLLPKAKGPRPAAKPGA